MRTAVEARRPQDFGLGRLFWAMNEAVMVVDATQRRIVLYNPAAEAMFGYRLSEAMEMAVQTIVPGWNDEWSETPREVAALRKSGEELVVELALVPLEASAVDGSFVLALLRDVTERKRAEEEQQAKLKRERIARAEAEAAQQRSAFLAEAGKQLAASLDYEVTLARIARLTVPELADFCIVDVVHDGEQVRRVEVAHADPAGEALARRLLTYAPNPTRSEGVPRVLRTGEAVLYQEVSDSLLEAKAVDAEHLGVLWAMGPRSLIVAPLLARGRPLGAISFVSVSPRRRYGPAELALAEELAARCALAVDNARLYQAVQQAMETRDQFLAGAAHDLKTPLTAVRGYAQLLIRQLSRMDGPQAEKCTGEARQIVQSAVKMQALIDQLLDVARLQSGQPLELFPSMMDLVALARQVADEHQQATRRHQIRVLTKETELLGEWDATRLERALANLLENAIKYSPGGGEIILSLWREEAPPEDTGSSPAANNDSHRAALAVEDHGVGIPAADLPHVFERFRRGANVPGRISGTGIGLAGVQHIVQQHWGTIDVESQEGVGTRFTVRLPL